MQDTINTQLESYISSCLSESYQSTHSSYNIFDNFITRCQLYYDRPAHSIGEIKLKLNKRLKGDIFEHFCYKYMLFCYKDITQVWFLKDLPQDICLKLNLKNHDLGIDLVAIDKYNRYYAIQAKYRKKNQYKPITVVGWKELSTFYGIVTKTGPYFKHIVITNANYIRHIGVKTKKDQSICYGTLKNIKSDQWLSMTNQKGNVLDSEPSNSETEIPKITFKKKSKILSTEELRLKRLQFFDNLPPLSP